MKNKLLHMFLWPFLLCAILFIFNSCEKDDPVIENVPEIITTTRLVFVPVLGGNVFVYEALDPDGDGPENVILEDIVLDANTTYILSIELFNKLLDPKADGYDITQEIKKEKKEHQVFFEWKGDVFTDPTNGNIQNNKEDINYRDKDENDVYLGLETLWVTGSAGESGTFRIVLKHLVKPKLPSMGINDGETDLDYTFEISLQ